MSLFQTHCKAHCCFHYLYSYCEIHSFTKIISIAMLCDIMQYRIKDYVMAWSVDTGFIQPEFEGQEVMETEGWINPISTSQPWHNIYYYAGPKLVATKNQMKGQ